MLGVAIAIVQRKLRASMCLVDIAARLKGRAIDAGSGWTRSGFGGLEIIDLEHHPSAYFLGSLFQKSMPPACAPTSMLATFAIVRRSITSTVPGCAPLPSSVTNA